MTSPSDRSYNRLARYFQYTRSSGHTTMRYRLDKCLAGRGWVAMGYAPTAEAAAKMDRALGGLVRRVRL